MTRVGVTRVLRFVPRPVRRFFRRVTDRIAGPARPDNPYYAELRRLHDRGALTPKDFERIVVPLILERGEREFPQLRRDVRRSTIENRVLYLFAVGLAVLSAALFVGQGHLSDQQRSGRRVGLAVTCAAISATSEAGKAVITGSILPPETRTQQRFERNLRKLGYPPLSERKAAAQIAARAYVQNIAQTVQRQSGLTGIVRHDGTLDCDLLRKRAEGAR